MFFFREIFHGLRVNWQSRCYAYASVLRKYLFIWITIGFFQVEMKYKLFFVTSLQSIYLVGMCVCFPFSHYKNNIIEIANEFCYMVFI